MIQRWQLEVVQMFHARKLVVPEQAPGAYKMMAVGSLFVHGTKLNVAFCMWQQGKVIGSITITGLFPASLAAQMLLPLAEFQCLHITYARV